MAVVHGIYAQYTCILDDVINHLDPVICVPCVYLIAGETGTCLESIAGYASASDLVQKIKKVTEVKTDTTFYHVL